MIQRKGLIAFEWLVSLGIISIFIVAMTPFITTTMQAAYHLSRRIEDTSGSLFAVDFMVEKIRNTLYSKKSYEEKYSNTFNYYEQLRTGENKKYTFLYHYGKVDVKLYNGRTQPLIGGVGGIESPTFVESTSFFHTYPNGLVEISAIFGDKEGTFKRDVHTAIFPYVEYYKKGKIWGKETDR